MLKRYSPLKGVQMEETDTKKILYLALMSTQKSRWLVINV